MSLSQVITNHNHSHHLYADDTQVYISLSQSNAQESVSTLSDCLTDILFWMESSKLKLNPDKTDLIITCTKQHRNRVISPFPVKLLGSDTFPSDTVRNLGVVFDSEYKIVWHVWYSGHLSFHHHFHYLNSYTGFLLLIKLILSSVTYRALSTQ